MVDTRIQAMENNIKMNEGKINDLIVGQDQITETMNLNRTELKDDMNELRGMMKEIQKSLEQKVYNVDENSVQYSSQSILGAGPGNRAHRPVMMIDDRGVMHEASGGMQRGGGTQQGAGGVQQGADIVEGYKKHLKQDFPRFKGPKDWLREQKKKSSRFLLAPIDASRTSLQSAYVLLTNSGSEIRDNDQEEVQKLLRSAARDCIPQERNSFVSFQANTGVEVCTFQLVLNNASSLLAEKDPTKLEAEAKLGDLIRSFSSLNGMANETGILFDSNREKVADALMEAIATLNKVEQRIKDCLEI